MHPNGKTKADRHTRKGASKNETWLALVLKVLTDHQSPVPLPKLYELVEPHPKTEGRKHWKAKVRQTLEQHDEFVRVGDGIWDLSSRHSAKALVKFASRRRERYPRRSEAAS
jgi:hypothetical protein